jgi:glycosyltransferase involved in cell wall biosynthesis
MASALARFPLGGKNGGAARAVKEAVVAAEERSAELPSDRSKPTRRPAVLQVLPQMGAGGVPRGTIEVAGALACAGWGALVASAGGPGVAELEAAGATHLVLPLETKSPLAMWRNAGRLARLITAHVDLVHARSRAPAWSALAAARRCRVPFVTTFHGTYGHGSALKRRYNAVMTKGDAVIAISGHIAEHIRTVYGVDEERMHIVHRGVDTARFDARAVAPERVAALRHVWGVPDGLPVVLLPGRLTRWKGQAVLIEAVARLARRDLCTLVVGDAQGREGYRAELEALIARHGLGRTVRIAGATADMPAAYLAADVVVSASTEPEAFGRVAVEAQAMGRPVIATAHGGALETVADGETGWLVAPGDAAALARAIERVLALDPAARARIGAAGVERVRRRFTTAAMCAGTLAVYRALLGVEEG